MLEYRIILHYSCSVSCTNHIDDQNKPDSFRLYQRQRSKCRVAACRVLAQFGIVQLNSLLVSMYVEKAQDAFLILLSCTIVDATGSRPHDDNDS